MRDDYDFVIGRAVVRVRRSWTQGAYSRHIDGRPLQKAFGYQAQTVDIVGALYQSAHDLGYTETDADYLRDFVTLSLPLPYRSDPDYGLEHFNDAPGRTVAEVVAVLEQAKELVKWHVNPLPFPSVLNAA